jgi:lipoyl-dependent peroxiredoxin
LATLSAARDDGSVLQTASAALRKLGRSRTQESTMIEKRASVHWEGAGKTGRGQVSTETGALQGYPYSVSSRFADDRKGTNPEEILGAAHAACFTMFFAVSCEKAGINVSTIDTTALVRLAKDGEGFKIDRIALTMEAAVPGIDQAKFQELADGAKKNCPVSKALGAVPEITLDAKLRS